MGWACYGAHPTSKKRRSTPGDSCSGYILVGAADSCRHIVRLCVIVVVLVDDRVRLVLPRAEQPRGRHLQRERPLHAGEAAADRARARPRPERRRRSTAVGSRASSSAARSRPARTYHCDAPCLGISYITKHEVADELTERYPATIWLAIGGVDHLPHRRSHAGRARRALARHRHRQVPGDQQPDAQLDPLLRRRLLAWIYLVNEWGIFTDGNDYAACTEDPAQVVQRPAAALARARRLPVDPVRPVHPRRRWSRRWVRTTSAPPPRRACPPTRSSSSTRCALRSSRSSRSSAWTSPRLLAGTIFTEYIFAIDGIGKWGHRRPVADRLPGHLRYRLGVRRLRRAVEPDRRHRLQLHRPESEACMTGVLEDVAPAT